VIYLCSPYTHTSEVVRNDRYLRTCVAAAKLIKKGQVIFSPIVHSLPLVKFGELGTLFSDWIEYNKAMMDISLAVAVLPLSGWEQSNGVAFEIDYALKNNITLWKVDLEKYEYVAFSTNIVPDTIKEYYIAQQ